MLFTQQYVEPVQARVIKLMVLLDLALVHSQLRREHLQHRLAVSRVDHFCAVVGLALLAHSGFDLSLAMITLEPVVFVPLALHPMPDFLECRVFAE